MAVQAAAPGTDTANRPAAARTAVLLIDPRRGPSTMAAVLGALGMQAPNRDTADAEARWVVDFHDRLLRRANVQELDARTQAWLDAGRLAVDEDVRSQVRAWLERQFAAGPAEVLISEPRLAWFQGLWRSAALRCGAAPVHLVMLEPIAPESGRGDPRGGLRDAPRVAGWINAMLHVERATRDEQRAFIRSQDLIDDWTVPVHALGERFDLATIRSATTDGILRVHDLIGGTARPADANWERLDAPSNLRDLAAQTWRLLEKLTDPAADGAQLRQSLDGLRESYAQLYAEAEALTQSTVWAVNHAAAARTPAGAARDRLPTSLGDRLSARIPHGVRAAIPPRARQRVKTMLNRGRRG